MELEKKNKFRIICWFGILLVLGIIITLGFIANPFAQEVNVNKIESDHKINFEINVEISLFDFPCKVVIYRKNSLGTWESSSTNIIMSGNGTISGTLDYEDYVLLKIFPLDEPTTMIAQHFMFIQSGKSTLKWDNTEYIFKREGSFLDHALLHFMKEYEIINNLKNKEMDQYKKDSLSIVTLQHIIKTYRNNTENIMGIYLLTKFLSHELDPSEFEKHYSFLTSEMKDTRWGKFAKMMLGKMKKSSINGPAPLFNVTTIDSLSISLQANKGKVILLDFWASWCSPCINEFPYLQRLDSMYNSDELIIIGVSTDKSKEKLLQSIEKYSLNWTQVLDNHNGKILSNIYNVSRLPTNYLIDIDGNILAKNLRGEELVNTVTENIKNKRH